MIWTKQKQNKIDLDWSRYLTKTDLKGPTGTDTSKFTKKANLANSKWHIDTLDIDKLKNTPTDLSKLTYLVKN